MYIYRITNTITNEFYIGKRSNYTQNWFEDDYMGSGLVVSKLWIKKKIPVKKDILFGFTGSDLTEKFLNQSEGLIIRRWFTDKMCVNIHKGALPKWDFFNSHLESTNIEIHENIDELWGTSFTELLYELRTRPILFQV